MKTLRFLASHGTFGKGHLVRGMEFDVEDDAQAERLKELGVAEEVTKEAPASLAAATAAVTSPSADTPAPASADVVPPDTVEAAPAAAAPVAPAASPVVTTVVKQG